MMGLGARIALALLQPSDLTSDNDGYLAHARPIAEGRGFLGPYSDRPTAFRPPGYPMAIASLLAVGVMDPVAVMLINTLASAAIIWLSRILGLRAGLSGKFAMLAALIVAIDPLLVRYSVLPMTEVPCAAVLLAAIVLLRRAVDSETASTISSRVAAGMLFGIGALIRPVVLISCAFVCGHAVMTTLTNKAAGKSYVRLVLHALLPAVAAGLVLMPWVIRNAVHFQAFVPATTHGGYTLALGNNADFYRDVISGQDVFPWDGSALDVWQQRMIAQSKQDGVRQDDERALDAWYYEKATAAIKADPLSFLKATCLRLSRFWAITTAESTGPGWVSSGTSVWYALLWLGLLMERFGAWRLRKTVGGIRVVDLWLVVLSFMLMHSVYWTDARMRAPLMPVLVVLSLCGWQYAVVAVLRFGRKHERSLT